MIFKVAFRTLATQEVAEAYDWYESRKSGLGNDFLEDLEAFLSILEQHPETFSYYDKPVREGRLKRFPYTVVYEVFTEQVIIYSVFMARQNPSKKRTA